MNLESKTRIRPGFIAALTTLIAALGLFLLGQIGRLSPVLDVLSHLSSHYIAMAVCAAGALWFGRHHIAVLAMGALLTMLGHSLPGYLLTTALHHGGPISFRTAALALPVGTADQATTGGHKSENWPPRKRDLARGTRQRAKPGLTIISLNSWHSNRSPEKIIAYLKAARADVVVLIEFGPSKLKLLRKLAKDYPYQVHCANRWYCSLALISKLPFRAAKASAPTRTGPAIVWARLKTPRGLGLGGRDITVVGTHIYRPSTRPRLHVSHLAQLAKFVRKLKGPFILAGDFNATPWSQSYRDFLQKSRLRSAGTMLPSWPAWPVSLPQFAIDHIFASKQLTISARGIGHAVGSDHLPIWARVRLKKSVLLLGE